jgi:hypothetical protein
MSIYQLEVRYKDAPVWSVERRHTGANSRSYFANVYVPEKGETVPE